ncbi:MAG: FdhF/YdeP family oxidoreductase [Ilumatobacter sp.]
MSSRSIREPEASDVEVSEPETSATGLPAIASSMKRSISQMGVRRTVRTLAVINQPSGFDCPGCAWPEADPSERKHIEFCESGVKAVAEEATTDRVDREFFAAHDLDDLRTRSDFWLGRVGRLTEPMVKQPGGSHFEPVSWDAALDLVADRLRSLDDPNEAVLYPSGRPSNEAAYVYQLMAKCFGTNNLPDCSNMCHEPTGAALSDTIGIGKGSVRLSDFAHADTIVLAGQNPGTNHPRMLSTLEEAKKNGARIVSINPLPEAGLLNFKNPQTPRGLSGVGTPLADVHLPIRLGADHALFQLWNKRLVEAGEVDERFVADHTSGYDELCAHLASVDADDLLRQTGLDPAAVDQAYEIVASAERLIVCWAMGITQHVGAIDTIAEIVNLNLLGGHIGRLGAGLCPVRGHSNVQGDRTMGIWEKVQPDMLAALEHEFGVSLPTDDGVDVVDAIRSFEDGHAKVFIGLGGNFARATPDTDRTERALSDASLVVNLSTKLNRTHLVTDQTSLILPVLGRTEVDRQASGDQFVTVEDSMGMVHASTGMLPPPSRHARSEVAIVTGLAQRLLGADHPVRWKEMGDDYDVIREHIGRTVGGFNDFNSRVRIPGGFELPHPPRDSRTFETSDSKAHFTVSRAVTPTAGDGELVLQTTRSHDQYNTTIYGHDDRYRGLSGDRHVVMMNANDIARLGFASGDRVDLVTSASGPERRARGFRIVDYPTPEGTAAAYYPETNVLVPLDHHGPVAQTPASKSIVIRLERSTS